MRNRQAPLIALAAGSLFALSAAAQQGNPTPQPAPSTASLPPGITLLAPGEVIRDPRAINMDKLLRPLSFEVEDTRLENVIQFITDITGADIEPLWIDDRETEGLRKDQLISLRAENMQALAVIERVLRQATDDFDRGTWQFNESGTLEIGPRSRLNRAAELKIYDINDLTISLLNISRPPSIDLGGLGNGGGAAAADSSMTKRTMMTSASAHPKSGPARSRNSSRPSSRPSSGKKTAAPPEPSATSAAPSSSAPRTTCTARSTATAGGPTAASPRPSPPRPSPTKPPKRKPAPPPRNAAGKSRKNATEGSKKSNAAAKNANAAADAQH